MTTGVMCHSLELICNCKSPFTYLQQDPGYHDFSSASLRTDGKIIKIKRWKVVPWKYIHIKHSTLSCDRTGGEDWGWLLLLSAPSQLCNKQRLIAISNQEKEGFHNNHVRLQTYILQLACSCFSVYLTPDC